MSKRGRMTGRQTKSEDVNGLMMMRENCTKESRLCSAGIFNRISLRTSITQQWLSDRIQVSVVLLLLLFNKLRASKVHHVCISHFSTTTNSS